MQGLLGSVGDSAPSRGYPPLFAALAQLYFVSGRYPECLEIAERASERARAVGDERTLIQSESRRAVALKLLGRAEEALAVNEEVISLAEKAGDLETLCRVLNNAADEYQFRGEFAKARAYRKRALAAAEPLGDPNQIAFMTGKLGLSAYFEGDWVEAHASAERAVAILRASGPLWGGLGALEFLGQICLCQGRLEEAIELAQTIGFPYAEGRALYAHASMQIQMADAGVAPLGKARERLQQALEIFRRLGARPYVDRTEQALAELDQAS